MEKIGEILRNTRQEKGISLREVEEKTKIRLKYLEALENDDYDQIPGRVYALGFLRNYARYLGLEVEELSKKFKDKYPPKEEDVHIEEPKPIMPGMRIKKWNKLFLIVGVLVILWGINLIYNNYQIIEQPSMPPFANPEPANDLLPKDNLQPPLEQETPVPQIQGVELKIRVTGDCWIGVKIDGTDSFSGILKPGESKVFNGDKEITITLGNAGAAELTVNGEVLPALGDFGEVVTETFEAPN